MKADGVGRNVLEARLCDAADKLRFERWRGGESTSTGERETPVPAIAFVLPVRTKNPANMPMGNSRLAAIIRTQERAKHRACALLLTRAAMMRARISPADLVPCVVTLTRVSAGTMDGDGLQGSQKGVRDGIAEALCVDDGSVFVRWKYAQAKCPRGQHAVRVQIQRRSTP